MDQGSVEHLLSRQRAQEGQWIEEAVKNVSSRNPKISMDRESAKMLLRRNPKISMDRESVELLLKRQRAQENFSVDRESVEDSVETRRRKLDRKESIEDVLRSCRA